MKEITHEETRKFTVTDGYMSDDGIMFKTERECLRHEKEIQLKKLKSKCPALVESPLERFGYEIAQSLFCSDNDTFYKFRPKSQADIDSLLAYIKASGSDYSVDTDSKGTVLLKDYFVFESDDVEFIALFSRDYVERLYRTYVELMFGKEDCE